MSRQAKNLKDFIDDVVMTIRSSAKGYDSVYTLACHLMNDCAIDGETTAKNFGYSSFKDFLHSKDMRSEIEIRNDNEKYIYVARPTAQTAHIHQELVRSDRAREQRQEKERYFEQNAGTIGRKCYGEDGASNYFAPPEGFSLGFSAQNRQFSAARQPEHVPQRTSHQERGVYREQSELGVYRESQYQESKRNSYQEPHGYREENSSDNARRELPRSKSNLNPSGFDTGLPAAREMPSHPSSLDPIRQSSVGAKNSTMENSDGRRQNVKPPPAKVVKNIIWDEDEEDEEDNLDDAGRENVSVPTAKKPEPNGQSVIRRDSYDDDDDDSVRKSQEKPKDKAPAQTRWTSRDKTGEFTDDDESEDESNDDSNIITGTKPSSYQNVTSFPETKGIFKPHVPSVSSSETSTLHDESPPAQTKLPSPKKSVDPAPREPIPLEKRAPASHGEKWLFEAARQSKEKASRNTPSPSIATDKNAANIFRPVKEANITVAAKDHQQPTLHRPTAYKPESRMTETPDRLDNEFTSPQKLGAQSVSANGQPLRRSGSMTSVYSTATTRKWSRILSDDDLKKMSYVVNSIVQYHFPRFVLMDDLIAVVEMVEPRFASLEQAFGGDFLEYIKRFCTRVEVIGRCGHFNLAWREDGNDAEK